MGLFDLFSDKNEKKAAEAKKAGLDSGYSLATDLFGQGRDQLTQSRDKSLGYFGAADGSMATAGRGYDALADATGANGAAGFGRANQLFQMNPGYASGMSSGLDALDRRAASRGMLNSGNNMQDTMKFASDYNNKNYGDFVSRLMGAYQGAPNLQAGLASAKAGLETGYGSSMNNSLGGQGLLGYQTEVGKGNADAAYQLSKDATGANILSGIGSGLNLATKLFGMF